MDRVQYYSNNGLAICYDIKTMERAMVNFNSNQKCENINDIIELYNIKKYIENGIDSDYWSSEDESIPRETSKFYMGIIRKFLGSISDKNIQMIYNSLEMNYKSNFWELINDFKIYKRISPDAIYNILKESTGVVYHLLEYKKNSRLLWSDYSRRIIVESFICGVDIKEIRS